MKTRIACAAFAACAFAAAVQAAPRGEGSFDFRLAPGRGEEVCLKLAAGETLDWRFSADAPLAFNLHWHAGSDVFFGAREAAVAEAAGRWRAEHADTYCLMWTAPAGAAVRVVGEALRGAS